MVHRRIGMCKQRRAVFAIFGVDGNADAGCQQQVTTIEQIRPTHQIENAARHHQGVLRPLEVNDQGRKLVATEPRKLHFGAGLSAARLEFGRTRDQIGGSHATAQPIGRTLQYLVADGVAEAIVDVLESVQVHEQHADLVAAVPGAFYFPINPLQKRLPVRQPCQAVKKRQLEDFLFCRLALGDVTRQDDELRIFRVRRPFARHRQLEPEYTVRQLQLELLARRDTGLVRHLQGLHAGLRGQRRHDLEQRPSDQLLYRHGEQLGVR